jgi:hypothetical protein
MEAFEGKLTFYQAGAGRNHLRSGGRDRRVAACLLFRMLVSIPKLRSLLSPPARSGRRRWSSAPCGRIPVVNR